MKRGSPSLEPIYAWIGVEIASTRHRRRLTQIDLAARLGMTRAAVSNMEQGDQRIMLHVLMQIAEILDASVARLIGRARSRARSCGVPAELLPRAVRRPTRRPTRQSTRALPSPPRAPRGRPRGRRIFHA